MPRLSARPAAPAASVSGIHAIRSNPAAHNRPSAQAVHASASQWRQPQPQWAQQQRRQRRQHSPVSCAAEPPSCPITGAAAAGKQYKTDEDRLSKYGWGSLRMALLLGLALAVAPQFSADPQAAAAVTDGYLHSWSWVGHATIGAAGAVVSWEAQGQAG